MPLAGVSEINKLVYWSICQLLEMRLKPAIFAQRDDADLTYIGQLCALARSTLRQPLCRWTSTRTRAIHAVRTSAQALASPPRPAGR